MPEGVNLKRTEDFRRHHNERMVMKGLRNIINNFGTLKNMNLLTTLGKMKKTRCTCSNPFCCGNPRHIKGTKTLTKQELIAELKEKEID